MINNWLNKYYEWKVLTPEGRLIAVPPVEINNYYEYLTGTFCGEEDAADELKLWLHKCQCKAPDDLTLVPFYNN